MHALLAIAISFTSLFGSGTSDANLIAPLRYIVDNQGNGWAYGEDYTFCRFRC